MPYPQTLPADKAGKLAGDNPDYGIQTLFESIESGRYPSWTVYIQTMTPQQAEKFRYNVLDLTKVGILPATYGCASDVSPQVWPHKEYPLRPVGKIVLNENPQNYFAEIEQVRLPPMITVISTELFPP